VACTGEDVLIGPGSKELMFLLQFVYYGDLVIPTPSWVSYAPQARIIGRTVHWLPKREADEWMLTADQFEAFCALDPDRPRIVILNYPSNPTGASYDQSQLEALADVARQYQVILLSDEIYGELHHAGRHVSIARFYPEGTIISSGLSKWCGAGGWRLGTFAFPRDLAWLRDAMAAVASETYTSTSAPIQYAAVRAFRGGLDIERYLVNSRAILSALGKSLTAKLCTAGVPAPCHSRTVAAPSCPAAPVTTTFTAAPSRRSPRWRTRRGVAVLP
jgi:aspartate aminotransferase